MGFDADLLRLDITERSEDDRFSSKNESTEEPVSTENFSYLFRMHSYNRTRHERVELPWSQKISEILLFWRQKPQ